jgi:ribosomal protein L20A (L18A)
MKTLFISSKRTRRRKVEIENLASFKNEKISNQTIKTKNTKKFIIIYLMMT